MSTCSGVLLLHGYGRSGRAMAPLARAARSQGYAVLAPTYRSRRPMADIVAWLAPHVAAFEATLAGDGVIAVHTLRSAP